MTGIGLAVALPAVMGYNWLTPLQPRADRQARRLRVRASDLPVDGARALQASGRRRQAGQRAARRREALKKPSGAQSMPRKLQFRLRRRLSAPACNDCIFSKLFVL